MLSLWELDNSVFNELISEWVRARGRKNVTRREIEISSERERERETDREKGNVWMDG